MEQQRQRQNEKLLQQALLLINERFPPKWSLTQMEGDAVRNEGANSATSTLRLSGPNGTTADYSLLLMTSCEPRQANVIAQEMNARVAAVGEDPLALLVIAPWLSQRSQQLLAEAEINFLDLTGNIRLTLSEPVFYFQMSGSPRNPKPVDQVISRVRGPKAGRLLRFLAEVEPPYSVTEIASATALTAGYISRLLETLDRDALIDRGPRGRVVGVALAEMLRRWAENYQVFHSNRAVQFLAPNGLDPVVSRLAESPPAADIAVSGSFAAVRHAPVAAPSLLMIYCRNAEVLASQLQLLPTDRGANVVLLEPADDGVFFGTEKEGGISFVAPAQAVVDCLTGNGRMPAEGEALLEWMLDHRAAWQSASVGEHLARTLGS